MKNISERQPKFENEDIRSQRCIQKWKKSSFSTANNICMCIWEVINNGFINRPTFPWDAAHCFIVRSIQNKSRNRKSACITSSAPGARSRNWVRLLAVLVVATYVFSLCPLFLYMWKAWVSIPIPRSKPSFLLCWALFIKDREWRHQSAVSLFPPPRNTHCWILSAPGGAAERGR